MTLSTKQMLVHCGLTAVAATLCISWLQIRPFGIIFLVLFSFWFYKTRCNVKIIPPPELHSKLTDFCDRVKRLRNENPTSFCAISTVTLGVLAVFGHLMSGSSFVLIGLIFAALLSTKYNFKIVKLQTKDLSWMEKLDNDVDEFLPEVNESNLFVLERASDLATLSSPTEDGDDKSEEIPSDLLIPDSIPEIDENTDNSSEDELQIKPPPIKESRLIQFKKGHFKKDSSISTSSSSDEESLSKGLNFQDYTVTDSKDNKLQMQMSQQSHPSSSSSSNILPSLVSGIVSWSMGGDKIPPNSSALPRIPKRTLESSDESDFEILDTDDFK